LLGSNTAGLCIIDESFLKASMVCLPDEHYSADCNNANNRNNNSPR
jgi:hypothetical protein